MDLSHILVADLDPNPCLVENCTQLSNMIRRSLPVGQIYLQTLTSFPPGLTFSPPDLLVLRPSFAKSLPKALCALRREWNQTPMLGLFCTAWNTLSDTFISLLHGLDDFLTCPFKEIDISPRIQRLLHAKHRAVSSFQMPAMTENAHLEPLVGRSECFTQVLDKIPLLAHSDATVLISGETGTGKELVARAIHYHSVRQGKPFIAVNCGALPDHLFENELFGHAKGAFTDASSTEKGLVAEAQGGTLFLDEIDALTASTQIKLLRFLQDRGYRPLGSSKSLVADVRVIAATNANLRQRVVDKLFREDLYYRLNVLSLSLPPLRERLEDIPHLAVHLLTQYGREYGRESLHLSSSTVQKLLAYCWPGNVRELEGVIQRAVILTSSLTIQPDDIDLPYPSQNVMSQSGSLREAKVLLSEQFERGYLIKLLADHEGNVSRAAKSAGKERRAFQRLLRKYNIDRCTFRSFPDHTLL